MGGILSVLNVVCKTDPCHLTITEHGKAGTLVSSITGNTTCIHFLTNNVNFSFKAAGTNAAHRLSLVPTSEMGQLALEKKNEGEEGSQHYLTKTVKIFSLSRKKVLEHLEKQSTHPTNFGLFLNKYFKILINNSDCKQNSSARTNGPEEVGQH